MPPKMLNYAPTGGMIDPPVPEWTPMRLSNLRAWYTRESLASSAGTPTSWPPESTTGTINQTMGTVADAPTISTGGAPDFDGTDDAIHNGTATTSVITDASGFMWVVAKFDTATAGDYMFGAYRHNSGANRIAILSTGTSLIGMERTNATDTHIVASNIATSAAAYFGVLFYFDGTNPLWYLTPTTPLTVCSAVSSSGTTANANWFSMNNPPNRFSAGVRLASGSPSATTWFNGRVWEGGCAGGTLDAGTQAKMQRWLRIRAAQATAAG